MNDVKILGTYSDKNNLPAIIKCNVGKGIAILSGVHFEFDLSSSFKNYDKNLCIIYRKISLSQNNLKIAANIILNNLVITD